MDENIFETYFKSQGFTADYKSTDIGTYSFCGSNKLRSNMSKAQNRLNAGWARAQFIYAKFDENFSVEATLQEWKKYFSNYGNQYLCLEVNPNEYKYFDWNCNEIEENHFFYLAKSHMPLNISKQTIFYGAPGTGKSFGIKPIIAGNETYRTTFHPDTDYASFVGCYKPNVADDGHSITYKFTKQIFTKAYIAAWEKYDTVNNISSVEFSDNDAIYQITDINDIEITYIKDQDIRKNVIKSAWDICWKEDTFVVPIGPQSGISIGKAIAAYIVDKKPELTRDKFEDGWTWLINTLNNQDVIEAQSKNNKSNIYRLSKSELQDCIHVQSDGKKPKKETLRKYFDSEDDCGGVFRGILELDVFKNTENFDEAWENLKEIVINSKQAGKIRQEPDQIYLVIEEINRGNCAQIFGDLFQLLDRNKYGYSEYPIDADDDLGKELKAQFSKLKMSESLKSHIDSFYKTDYPKGVIDKVLNGEYLVLPSNLNILATMNTSDQSLFPMDSAFKRRWEWKYQTIKDENKGWKIQIGDKYENINWWSFLERINKIVSVLTTSEDKQLGYFFCKPDKKLNDKDNDKKVISLELFVNKVIFYLWNDVFKDYAYDVDCCKDTDGKEVLFAQFYNDEGVSVNTKVVEQFFDKLKDEKGNSLLNKIDDTEPTEEASLMEDTITSEEATPEEDVTPAE